MLDKDEGTKDSRVWPPAQSRTYPSLHLRPWPTPILLQPGVRTASASSIRGSETPSRTAVEDGCLSEPLNRPGPHIERITGGHWVLTCTRTNQRLSADPFPRTASSRLFPLSWAANIFPVIQSVVQPDYRFSLPLADRAGRATTGSICTRGDALQPRPRWQETPVRTDVET